MILLCILFVLQQYYCQTSNPNYYWDFTKVSNINGVDQIVEQNTQDNKLSFGFFPAREQYCQRSYTKDEQKTDPVKGPDGVFFKSYYDSIRLENAVNIGFSGKYMIAMWIKYFPNQINGGCNYRSLMRVQRYNYWSDLYFDFGVTCIDNRPQFYWQAFSQLVNSYAAVTQRFPSQNVTTSIGWYLISAAVDTTSNKYNFTLRLRGPDGKYDNYVEGGSGWTFNESLYETSVSDFYIGAYCVPNQGHGIYQHSAIFVMSKLYIWVGQANLVEHFRFDRFFFRRSGALTADSSLYVMPVCTNAVLQCVTESVQDSDLYWANYDFDLPAHKMTDQYVQDLSGNGYHFLKNPVNQVGPNEVFRIYGQGVLFYNGAQLQSTQQLPIFSKNQFTVEVWYRKILDSSPQNVANGYATAAPFFIFDSVQNRLQYALTLSDRAKRSWFCFRNCNAATVFDYPTLLQTNKWTFFSISFGIVLFDFYNQLYVIRHQIDTSVKIETLNGGTDYDTNYTISDKSVFQLGANDKTIMYKSLKIFKYAKLSGDDADISIFSATDCQTIGNQASCDVCPRETGKCLSLCSENTYGDSCTPCHPFCGHCTGATKNDCVFCARNMTPANVYFNPTFGNCSCTSGRYYNSSLDSCQPCHANCQECFGYNYDQCLSCKSTKFFYQPTYCFNDCADPLLINGIASNVFYQTTETILSQTVKICKKCHPYCSSCTNSTNSNCQSCFNGYFLQNTSICYSTCPNGQYPDTTDNTCKLCHSSCATCTGPNPNQCLTCTNTAYVSQSNTCQAQCDVGYFPDSSQICQTCNSACKTCTGLGTSNCPSCNSGFYLQWLSTTCLNSCPDGYYKDTAANSCFGCHYSCQTCTNVGPDSCVKCNPGYLKKGSYCVTQCSENEFEVNGSCQTCDSKCSKCYGTLDTQCYTCNSNTANGLGYYYLNDQCMEKCPDGYYADNVRQACLKCPTNCATCTSSTYCTSCVYGPYQLNNGECTYFTCLDTQYRAIRPTIACYFCDQTCKTCQGFSQFDCLSCSGQSIFSEQQCLSCSQQPGMTDAPDGSGVCVEICGDGFNYGQVQCDDGNLKNGDGCSSKCTIESGFNCTSGSQFTPSVCMDNQNPVPAIVLVSSANTVYIQFDEEVFLQQTISTSNVLITVTGPQSSYKFDWKLSEEYKTSDAVQMIAFEFSFYSSLKGNSKELITIQFQDQGIYVDGTGNGMITLPMTSYLNKFDYIDPQTKAQIDAASDTSILATYGVVVLNLVISQLFGGSIAAMWTMVNTLQLLSLIPLCNINYPPLVVMVLQKMLSTHGESTMIPNVFYDYIVSRPGSAIKLEQALNSRFSSYGWPISNFLYLSGRKIVLWTVLILVYPFVWYMKRKYADKHKLCQKWISIEQKFRYTLLLRGVIMSFVSMYLAFLLGVYKMNLTTFENSISAFSAIGFGIMLTYLPIMLMNILQRNYSKIDTPKFMLSYSTIVKEVDLSHPIRYMYYPVFLLRRILFAAQLVIFAEQPQQQCVVMAFTAIVMIVYVVLVQPQKDKVMIILTALGEGILVFLHMFSMVFLDEDLPDEKVNQYGWIILITIGLYIISNWIIIIKITIGQLKQKWRDFKEQREKRKQKQQEEKDYQVWKKKKHLREMIKRQEDRLNKVEAAGNPDFKSLQGKSLKLRTEMPTGTYIPSNFDRSYIEDVQKLEHYSPYINQYLPEEFFSQRRLLSPMNSTLGFNNLAGQISHRKDLNDDIEEDKYSSHQDKSKGSGSSGEIPSSQSHDFRNSRATGRDLLTSHKLLNTDLADQISRPRAYSKQNEPRTPQEGSDDFLNIEILHSKTPIYLEQQSSPNPFLSNNKFIFEQITAQQFNNAKRQQSLSPNQKSTFAPDHGGQAVAAQRYQQFNDFGVSSRTNKFSERTPQEGEEFSPSLSPAEMMNQSFAKANSGDSFNHQTSANGNVMLPSISIEKLDNFQMGLKKT